MKPSLIAAAALLVFAPMSADAKVLKTSCQTDAEARERSTHSTWRDATPSIMPGLPDRARRGARAENVATGNSSKALTMAQWSASPPHAANMLLPGCKGIASAVSRSGRHYWTMEIAQ